MSRTVTGIFSSRSDAEEARLQLSSAVDVRSAQILARETAAALDNLAVDLKDAQACREALQAGDHVLVATVARGEPTARIIDALAGGGDVEREESGPRLSYDIGAVEAGTRSPGRVAKTAAADAPVASHQGGIAGIVSASREVTASTPRGPAPASKPDVRQSAPEAEAIQKPADREAPAEIRIGQPRAAQSAAGKMSKTAAGRDVFESRLPARRLSQEEVEAGGLLKNRVIEVVEMREEPVISKEVVVREEVIIRKTADDRIATVDDTVRRTQVEIEELP